MKKTFRQSVFNFGCEACSPDHLHGDGEISPPPDYIRLLPDRQRKRERYISASSIPTIAENILTELDGHTDRTTKEMAVSLGIYHGRVLCWLDILRARGSVVAGPRRRCGVEGRRVGTWKRGSV